MSEPFCSYCKDWKAAPLMRQLAEAQAAIRALKEDIAWMAQTVHQAHHGHAAGTYLDCRKGICTRAAAIARAEGKC